MPKPVFSAKYRIDDIAVKAGVKFLRPFNVPIARAIRSTLTDPEGHARRRLKWENKHLKLAPTRGSFRDEMWLLSQIEYDAIDQGIDPLLDALNTPEKFAIIMIVLGTVEFSTIHFLHKTEYSLAQKYARHHITSAP